MTRAPSTPASRPAPADLAANLRDALAAGDLPSAAAILEPLGKSLPAEILPLAAQLRMAQQRWTDAVRLLNRQIDADPVAQLHKRFARNMAALQEHRPTLYAAVLAAKSDEYNPVTLAGNLPSLMHRPPGGAPVMLSGSSNPLADLRRALIQLAVTRTTGEAIGVWGLGDGYLVAALAADPPPLLMTQQQCVHIIIPDAACLRAVLHIHDYAPDPPSPGMRSAESPGYSASAADPALLRSPIAAQRFRFYVGPDWLEQLHAAFLAEPDLNYPRLVVHHGREGEAIAQRLVSFQQHLNEQMKQLTARVEAFAGSLHAADLARLFSATAPRPPRVLLFTSRFTTVLQHSARDTAAAFVELGWQTQITIETSDHHVISGRAILQAIDTFRPDLLFMIDHLRSELGAVIPPQIPLICWAQDQLPNLTCRRAGRTVTPRDFVMTGIVPMYRDHWDYPARQLIECSSLTRVPRRPPTWPQDGDDLAYVSNGPPPVADLVDAALESASPQPHLVPVVRRCCDDLLAIYGAGGAVATLYDMGRVVDAAAAALGVTFRDPPQRAALVTLLMHPLNNALYRQQAIRWVVDVAREMNLTFGLHGRGWDKLPEFAPFARGPVGYGPDLEELTRRTRINLQIVPWYCLHSRLLGGLVAGGFFLVRRNPTDALLPEFAAFLARNLPGDVQCVDHARRMIDPSKRGALEDLLRRAACLGDLGHNVDIVEWVRSCRRTEILDDTGEPLPHYDDIVFDDTASLKARITRFLADAPARAAIAQSQRKSIEHRLSYAAGLRRAIQRIAQLLADEASHKNER